MTSQKGPKFRNFDFLTYFMLFMCNGPRAGNNDYKVFLYSYIHIHIFWIISNFST